MCRDPACRQVQELELSTSATAAFRWDERREQRKARVWNERDRGKRITPLPPLPQYWVVLVPLPRVLSTAAVYQAVTPADYTSGVATADVVAAAQRGSLSPQAGWHNALARPARTLAPQITEAQAALLQAGAQQAHVSGSGPTVFTVCREEATARTIAIRVREQGFTAKVAPLLPAGWARGRNAVERLEAKKRQSKSCDERSALYGGAACVDGLFCELSM